MNSLETEYSFLAPTWKLPSIGTPSMYPGASYSPSLQKLTPNSSIWNSTMQNPRYIPPNANRRNHPNQQSGGRPMQLPPSQQSGGRPMQLPPSQQSNGQHRTNEHSNNNFDLNDPYQMSIQSNLNNYPDNRGFNYPPPPPPSQPTQKRVQIIDHNHQTPLSERESQNSHLQDYNQTQHISNPHRNHGEDNKSDSTLNTAKRSNNFKIHEYLYGLAAPDPGSYVSAYKNQRRRLEDEKVNRKPVLAEYKNFAQNGGFGPAFGNTDHMKYEEKLDTEKKRKSYSKIVREVNQYKVEEHKRIQNNGGQQRTRHYAVPPPKHRRPDAMRSSFLSPQEVREFERRIKLEHDANCKCSLHASPHYSSA